MAPNKPDEEILKDMKKFLKKPRSIDELMTELGIGRRRVYRYLGHLSRRGTALHRWGYGYPTRYVISS